MKRRQFLQYGSATALGLALPVHAAELQFTSLAAASAALAQLKAAPALRNQGGMSPFRTLQHCAQSIEYSLHGYPLLKPAAFRATLGPLAARFFLLRGKMRHDVSEPIPGALAISETGDLGQAFARLERAIAAFQAAVSTGQALQPHFAYGDVDASDYARLHAFHLAEHFSTLQPV